mgnify:CR=1 FL=1
MPIEWTLSVDGKETLTGVGAGCFNAEDPCVRCLRSRNSVYEYLSKTKNILTIEELFIELSSISKKILRLGNFCLIHKNIVVADFRKTV